MGRITLHFRHRSHATVDRTDIECILAVHRRMWTWPRLCRCGLIHPCGFRRGALDDQAALADQRPPLPAADWYARHFASERRPA